MTKTLPTLRKWLLSMLFCTTVGLQAQHLATLNQSYQPPQPVQTVASLKDYLNAMQKQYQVHILYELSLVSDKSVPQNFTPATTFEQNLNLLLPAHNLMWEKLRDKVYIIKERQENKKETAPKEPKNESATFLENTIALPKTGQSHLQNIFQHPLEVSISGRVTSSEDNSSLPGVSVSVKGTTVGTVTDSDGKYKINAPNAESVLVFSFVGFVSEEVPIGGRTTVNVILVPDLQSLSEVIVVGYGTQKKSQVTGAISSVSAKEIGELPIANTQQALQGRVAGVDILTAVNRPGAEPVVRIRGRRSFAAGNDPLYVIDGIPVVGGIGDFNPNDIESIEVLKDASATAIYGSRGANGVILISLKRGKPGATSVTYDGYYGISQSLGRIDVMDGSQFAEYKRESRRATGNYPEGINEAADQKLFEPVELESIKQGRSTDYPELLLRQGTQQSHYVNVLGGSEKTQFGISGNFFREKGIMYNQDFTRGTLRFSLDHQINDRIRVGLSTMMTYSLRNGENFNPIGGAMQENPLGVPYDANGKLIFLPTTDGLRTNPLAEIAPGAIIDERKRTRVFNSLYGEVKIMDGLTYRLNFGPDLEIDRYGQFTGSQTNSRRGGDPTARGINFNGINYTIENILRYKKLLNGLHDIDVTAVHAFQRLRGEFYDARVRGVPAETQQYYNIGAATLVEGVASGLTQWSINSYMGRINYTFRDRYTVTLTGRWDGSSRFAEGNKYSFFPSVAVAWNLSNEDFMKGISFIDALKPRFSYGITGNQGIQPYQTQGNLGRTVYAFGTAGAFGYRPNALPNPALQWETSKTLNVGLDFSLFKGRVSGAIEYYQTNTSDLLLPRQLPISSGFPGVTQNLGATRNRGFEVTVSTINIDRPSGFRWSTDLNFFSNTEAIVDLYGDRKDDIGNNWFIGKPLTVFYDYEKIGIWQSNEVDEAKKYSQKPGEIKVKDQNNDGKINSDDRVFLGSDVAKWSGGLTNRFTYKGFDLSFFLFARVGQMLRSRFHDTYNTLFGRYNNLDVNYWTPTNPTNDFPRPNQNQEFPIYGSTLTYFDGSFVKVRNINFGYNIPTAWAEKIKMQSLRIYASVQQPFIFSEYRSKYKGIDPEVGRNAGNNREQTAELSADTPSAWLFLMGVNARF